MIYNGEKIINSNSKLKQELDKLIKVNLKKKFKIGSEAMKHYTSNIPKEKENFSQDLISNSDKKSSFDNNHRTSYGDREFKEISNDISEIVEKNEEKVVNKRKKNLINKEKGKIKEDYKFKLVNKNYSQTMSGFNNIIKDLKEDVKKEKIIKSYLKVTDSKKTIDKINNEADYIDLDSLYFIDKVKIRSKSFNVPKLNFSKDTKDVNSVTIDLDLAENIKQKVKTYASNQCNKVCKY